MASLTFGMRALIIAFDHATDAERPDIVECMRVRTDKPSLDDLRAIASDDVLYHACVKLVAYLEAPVLSDVSRYASDDASASRSRVVELDPALLIPPLDKRSVMDADASTPTGNIPTQPPPLPVDDDERNASGIDGVDMVEDVHVMHVTHTDPYVPRVDGDDSSGMFGDSASMHHDRFVRVLLGSDDGLETSELRCRARQIAVFRIMRQNDLPDHPVMKRVSISFSRDDVMLLPTHDAQLDGCVRSFGAPIIFDFDEHGIVEFSVSLTQVSEEDADRGIYLFLTPLPEETDQFRTSIGCWTLSSGVVCVPLLCSWMGVAHTQESSVEHITDDSRSTQPSVAADSSEHVMDEWRESWFTPGPSAPIPAPAIVEHHMPAHRARASTDSKFPRAMRWFAAAVLFGLGFVLCFAAVRMYKRIRVVDEAHENRAVEFERLASASTDDEHVVSDDDSGAASDSGSFDGLSEEVLSTDEPVILTMHDNSLDPAYVDEQLSAVRADMERAYSAIAALDAHVRDLRVTMRDIRAHDASVMSDRVRLLETRLDVLEAAARGVERIDVGELAEQVYQKLYGLYPIPKIEDSPQRNQSEDKVRDVHTSLVNALPKREPLRIEDIRNIPKFAGYSADRLAAYVERHNSAFGLE